MDFQAGIGCKNQLFCDIVGPLIGIVFLSLIAWFFISLVLNHRKTKTRHKSSQNVAKPRQKR